MPERRIYIISKNLNTPPEIRPRWLCSEPTRPTTRKDGQAHKPVTGTGRKNSRYSDSNHPVSTTLPGAQLRNANGAVSEKIHLPPQENTAEAAVHSQPPKFRTAVRSEQERKGNKATKLRKNCITTPFFVQGHPKNLLKFFDMLGKFSLHMHHRGGVKS
ncbi:MAG: hypothetical protein ACOX5Z_10015 [Desulfobulbus sp.]|jgi:hypothetical protein